MESHYNASLLLLLLLTTATSATRPDPDTAETAKTKHFIRSSCVAKTKYPDLCFTSLVALAGTIRTSPNQLAQAALSVSLATAGSTSSLVHRLAKAAEAAGGREAAEAVADCVENMADSVHELRESVVEMGQLRGAGSKKGRVGLMFNDIETWVSAALTDESACMDGVKAVAAGPVKAEIRRHIVKVARLTSNALSLVNALAKLQ